jgi:outer membrane protein, heavy metal efflux system
MNFKIISIGMVCLFTSYSSYSQKKLSLKETLDLARDKNPFFKAEKQNIDIARSDVTTAELKINPSGSIGWQQLTAPNYFPENTGFFSSDNRQISYQVSKTFQVKGQRNFKIQAASANLTITQINLSDYERTMLGNVAQQWLNVWYATRKLEILNLAKANSDTLLKINSNRLKNQVITVTDYTRTEIINEQYQVLLLGAHQTLKSEKNNLALTLGQNDSIETDGKELPSLVTLPSNLDSIVNHALHYRTDLLAARQSIEKSKIDVSLQKAIAAPQPNLGIGYSRQNRIPYWGISFSIPLPFYDRNQGEIAKASVSVTKAENLEDAITKQVKSEVHNAYQEYVTNKLTYENFASINRKSENVLKTVKFSYLKGGTTILDYLDAERTWFDTQNQYYDALYTYQKSIVQLLVASNLISSM